MGDYKEEMKFEYHCDWMSEDVSCLIKYKLNIEYEKNKKDYLIDFFEMKVFSIYDINNRHHLGFEEFLGRCGCKDFIPFVIGKKCFTFDIGFYKSEKNIELGNKLLKFAFEDYESKKKVYINGGHQFSIKE